MSEYYWIWHKKMAPIISWCTRVAADSSIWPLDEANLVHVSAVSSSAQCRCAVRPLRSSDTPPQCPTSIYLGWKNSDDQVLWKTTTYFNRKNDFIQLQSSLLYSTPVLFIWALGEKLRSKRRGSVRADREVGNRAASRLMIHVVLWDSKKKQITCETDKERRDTSGSGRSERLFLTSSWPHLETTVWVKPSVTVCFANCLQLMTLNLLASSLRVHQEVLLGQHDVFKASRSDN